MHPASSAKDGWTCPIARLRRRSGPGNCRLRRRCAVANLAAQAPEPGEDWPLRVARGLAIPPASNCAAPCRSVVYAEIVGLAPRVLHQRAQERLLQFWVVTGELDKALL